MVTFSTLLHLLEITVMNELKIITLMQQGQFEKAFEKLYRYFPRTRKHICQNSGSTEEALDIFQEALILLYKKVNGGISEKDFSCEGYLFTSSKLLWSNELRKKKVRLADSIEQNIKGKVHAAFADEDEIQKHIDKEAKYKTIEQVLLKLGEKCRTILELFYFKSLSMESIAAKVGFKTVESAKVQKYKCIESARKLALANMMSNQKTETL